MDCNTARMLLEFNRPQARELESIDRVELEQHLGHCPECDDLARARRQVDEHLGRAMRAVEVPDRLRAKLLQRLASERGNWYRRWARKAAPVGAAAALLLTTILAVMYFTAKPLPPIDASIVFEYVNHVSESPPTRQEVQAYYRELGIDVVLPQDLKYELLTAKGLADFKGKQVPLLVFAVRDEKDKDNPVKLAQVYLFSRKQFDFTALPDLSEERTEDGYLFKVAPPRVTNGGRQACVICFTGENWDWLKKPNPQV